MIARTQESLIVPGLEQLAVLLIVSVGPRAVEHRTMTTLIFSCRMISESSGRSPKAAVSQ